MYPCIETLECKMCKRTPDKWRIKKEGSKILALCSKHGETIVHVKEYLDGRKRGVGMRKDKQWLKEKLNTEKYYRETSELKAKTTYGELYDRGVRDGINVALEFVEQLNEQEKPVIPKFVADYIEKWKYEGLTMYEWFAFGNNDVDDDINKWLYNNLNEKNRRREHLLIDAIRYGYEVEK